MLLNIIQQPLLIMGMHRSGTSMLAQIMHRSGVFMGSDFTAYYESNLFQRTNEQLLKQCKASWDFPATTTQDPDFSERGFITEYASATRKPHLLVALLLQKKWGWKDPRNTFTLGSWLHIFPGLKAIHIVRNGIDTSLSLYERNMMLQPKTKWHSSKLSTLTSCFQLWEEYVIQAQQWQSRLGDRYLQVKYEDLIDHKQELIAAIKSFCGVNISESLKLIADKERGKKNMEAETEELKSLAASNKTFLQLGYVA
jgi:hypothetical protein